VPAPTAWVDESEGQQLALQSIGWARERRVASGTRNIVDATVPPIANTGIGSIEEIGVKLEEYEAKLSLGDACESAIGRIDQLHEIVLESRYTRQPAQEQVIAEISLCSQIAEH
jgi:hypothetical protein